MRVVIADDSLLFREGLSRLLIGHGFEIVGTAANADELMEQVTRHQPDIAIVDIRMPPTQTTEGLRAAEQIRSNYAGTGVLVLSQHVETHHALELLAHSPGGVGYLLKDRVSDLHEFCDAVRRVGQSGSAIDPEIISRLLARRMERDPLADLTERERDVLALIAEGRSNREISEHLFLAPKTVETHVHRIFTKLGLFPGEAGHRRVLAALTYLRDSQID